MDVQHIKGNQDAGPKEHTFTPEEVHQQTARCLANDKISEFQGPADTEKANVSQITMNEPNFLATMQMLVDKRLNTFLSQQESERVLKNQECLESDKMAEKQKEMTHKLTHVMELVFDIQKEKDDLFLELKETRNKLFMVEAQHRQDNEALEAKMKSLLEKNDLKKQNINELQDDRQSKLNTLNEEIVHLKSTNETLLTDLTNTINQHSLQAQSWQKKYDDLKNKYQTKLDTCVHDIKKRAQTSQALLDEKFKTELRRNYSLLDQLSEMHSKNEVLVRSEKANKLLNDSRGSMAADLTLLEDICLDLKKKCRGVFGRRMQEREIELEKMKRKMRETQSQPAIAAANSIAVLEGTSDDTDAPPSPPPFSLMNRLKRRLN